MEPEAQRSEEKTSESADRAEQTDQKVSELTMMGVEQMLRQSERGDDRRGRLGCVVFLVASLVVLVAAAWGLYSFAGSVRAMPAKAESTYMDWVYYPISDAMAPDEDRFTVQGLQLAVEAAGWEPVGEEGVVEAPALYKVVQMYAHEGKRMEVSFVDVDERSEARAVRDRVEPPGQALVLDTKAVVIEPADEAAAAHAEGLAMFLADYREKVLEENEASE